MKAIDYLKKGWCKGAMARTISGDPCDPNDPNAAAWCAIGALYVTYGTYFPIQYHKLLNCVVDHPSSETVADWNDKPSTTHEMIIEAFEKTEL